MRYFRSDENICLFFTFIPQFWLNLTWVTYFLAQTNTYLSFRSVGWFKFNAIFPQVQFCCIQFINLFSFPLKVSQIALEKTWRPHLPHENVIHMDTRWHTLRNKNLCSKRNKNNYLTRLKIQREGRKWRMSYRSCHGNKLTKLSVPKAQAFRN